MSENKELLEATVKGLEEKIQQLNTDYKNKLQELEDVNKPEIKASQMDVIDNGLQQTFENFDLDIEQFDYEVELDYDNKVVLSNLTFTDTYDLHEAIMKNIEKQLEDINKPELTSAQLDDVHNAIENAVNDFNFEDEGIYDKEFELDYDGRVNLSHININCTYELIEMIVKGVHDLFKEIKDEESNA